MRLSWASALLLLPGLATAQVPTVPAVAVQASDAAYSVGTGDVLAVTVYRAPEYNSVVEVAEDGTVVISAIGKVKVAGLTPSQSAAAIAGRLRGDGIFRDPIVNVMVQTYRSSTVFVLGNVAKPGEYPLDRGGLTITEVLARAGASLGTGGGTVRVLRGGVQQDELHADQLLAGVANRVVQPHDTLIVTESATFYIAGEVQRPGSFPIEPGLTMERAIALAGGVTLRGARSRLKVTRHEGAADTIIKAGLQDPVAPRDLIMVGARVF